MTACGSRVLPGTISACIACTARCGSTCRAGRPVASHGGCDARSWPHRSLNQTWALDFMADALYDRRRFRALTIIDEGNREGLAIDVGRSIPARRVTRVLDELIALHGRPTTLRMDNGPELTAQALVDWADERRIDLHYIQPGKPDQNTFIERFNRSYRTEVLNAHLFESLAEVRKLTEDWLVVYNQERPHDSLGRLPPLTFLPRLNPPVQSPFAVST